MRRVLPLLLILTGGCTAPPHKFFVTVDREPKSGFLTLNDHTTQLIHRGTTLYGERRISDASGKVTVHFKDGSTVECRIGYITNGEVEPHHFSILGQKCYDR